MTLPSVTVIGADIVIEWPGFEPCRLSVDQALQLVSHQRVRDAIRYAALEAAGRVPAAAPVDGQRPIESA